MKVNHPSLNPVELARDSHKVKKGASQKEGFGELLDNEISGISDADLMAEVPRGIDPMMMLDATARLSVTQASQVGEDRSIEEMSAIIDDMSALEDKLTRPGAFPRQIQEQWGAIQESLEALSPSLNMLPADHPLKAVGEELQILAFVESTKWNRGDYL